MKPQAGDNRQYQVSNDKYQESRINDQQSYKLLEPAAVARLTGLQLRARAVVEGFLTGLHQSPYHGFSVEFSQHRPYMPGDSLKHLDFRVLGRTGRYYIKQYQEETNLKAWILLDHSASMGYGSGAVSKLTYGKTLAAALALLLLRQRDAVGLVSFSGKVDSVMPPSAAMGWLNPLTVALDSLETSGETKISGALLDIAERVKRRGMVILISDLLDDQDKVIAGMRAIRHIGHELLVFHVLDPMELSFAFSRDARFRDLESGQVVPTRPWHIREEYRRQMEAFIGGYRQSCSQHRIDYRLFNTETPYEIALFEFLARRKRLM